MFFILAVMDFMTVDRLNAGEVSLNAAAIAACVTQAEFSDILKTVRAALGTEDQGHATNVTYEGLVNVHRIHLQEYAVACMEDTEAGLPRVDILKKRHGANVVSCAVFYWVSQLLEEPTVQERPLCQTYGISSKAFRSLVDTIDKECDAVADQIKSHLLQERSSPRALTSCADPNRFPTSTPTSPQKSPRKSALKTQSSTRALTTPSKTPSNKRGVVFLRHTLDDDDDSTPFPETPTRKKRRINNTSPTNPGASTSPTKRSHESTPAAIAAFHAAMTGSPPKPPRIKNGHVQVPFGNDNASQGAGSSTPHRPRTRTMEVDQQLSPSHSQAQLSPTRPAPRRRFRPVFFEQQQWCARDPKVERMWTNAAMHRDKMIEIHGHPFERYRQGANAVVDTA
ncbi:hypothetical protein PAXRUDRAFT_389020 [Paxillus rubicundulus Ve08.2h10]|uniref:Uncharacterized protein n=1 Tax=Paxillus rubicundulus Ve08.2h10 TaxID=930991 RepID=A0A0D0E3D1_9AGAM|nr:hypothetical protein PAXRUDRAFT_389020 [Paxillus rubicundulus Ve08.2h10]